MAETKTIYGHISLQDHLSEKSIYFRLHIAPEVTVSDCGNIGFNCARSLPSPDGTKLILQTSYVPVLEAIYERKLHVRRCKVEEKNTLFLEEGPRLIVSHCGNNFPIALGRLLQPTLA